MQFRCRIHGFFQIKLGSNAIEMLITVHFHAISRRALERRRAMRVDTLGGKIEQCRVISST